jgi:FK506-binding protein 6
LTKNSFSFRRLHYYAYFEHRDEPFDTSFKRRRPLEFRLGKCEVLPGIDLAISTMQRRERSKFIISSDLLYGELGCAPHIPESAWCLYVIELLTTNDPSTIIHDEQLSIKTTTTTNKQQIDDFAKRIRLAQTLRNTGNEEYANGQLDRALRSYNKARQLIHNKLALIDGKHEEQYHQLLLKLQLNSGRIKQIELGEILLVFLLAFKHNVIFVWIISKDVYVLVVRLLLLNQVI